MTKNREVYQVVSEYEFPCGDDVYIIPNVELEMSRSGHLVLPGRENMRILSSVTAALLQDTHPLSWRQFEFISDVFGKTFKDWGEALSLTKKQFLRWEKTKELPEYLSVGIRKLIPTFYPGSGLNPEVEPATLKTRLFAWKYVTAIFTREQAAFLQQFLPKRDIFGDLKVSLSCGAREYKLTKPVVEGILQAMEDGLENTPNTLVDDLLLDLRKIQQVLELLGD